MRFASSLQPAIFLRRYQRFLADLRRPDGSEFTVHCPNSGSMATCAECGWPARYSQSPNPRRKYPGTLEMLHNGQAWIGVNTHTPNVVVAEALAAGSVPELATFGAWRREVRYGTNSRIDLLGTGPEGQPCYVEVKNVTLLGADGSLQFPDAVTERGRKHLTELAAVHRDGARAVMFFFLQRGDGHGFRPAWHIDPKYAAALLAAQAAGVEILAYRAKVSPEQITLGERVASDLTRPAA